MKTYLLSLFFIVAVVACNDKTPNEAKPVLAEISPVVPVEVLAETAMATLPTNVTCDVSNYTVANWLNPDPVTQLGAVPVNGVATLPANKTAGTSTNCDFHIFSWQWFLYLMNSSGDDSRNFEDRSLYPVVDVDTCASVSTDHSIMNTRSFSPSVLKVIDMPDAPGQAGSGDALYDKNTNIIFYTRSFTKNECGVFGDGNFPLAGTPSVSFPTGVDQVLELKSSWRILTGNDNAALYYTVQGDIEGIGLKNLGLVGFHVVVNTVAHPEFVWATFEHKENAPDCTVYKPATGFSREQPIDGWTLASNTCNACIATNYTDGADLQSLCKTQCDFNKNATKPILDNQGNVLINGAKGQTPSNICLDRAYGDAPTPQSVHNIPNIEFLNTLLVGPDGILTTLDDSNKMAVLKNYFLGGAEWTDVSKITAPSQKFNTELAGSTALANSTLESYTQYGAAAFFETGCLSCHGGASNDNTALASHLLTSNEGGYPGLIERCDVKAGPIFSDEQAKTTCPTVCEKAMGWNGNWKTLTDTSTSVCGCNACVGE